ncbi:hypothetical protein H4R18_002755 [Coemansia javaensis]|uniref:RPA-interacting protein N-terminal domain-containing protein n=1 Tax=Coemansia javaensis TaxID=2761396 RepID=A0A9W8LHA8_9FUNG|nr:hypothetical protein H4R18_002755 [Coemansia javaensis]
MDSLFSSPPRQPPGSPALRQLSRQVSRSGGSHHPAGRMRRPAYRHLSATSRAARTGEQPWQQQFREQCLDRLTRAREHSIMARRQLAQMSATTTTTTTRGDTPMQQQQQQQQQQPALSESEIHAIVRQEWARFQAEMERQCLECGMLDDAFLDEIGEDAYLDEVRDMGPSSSSSPLSSAQMRELAEWEEYENQMLEQDVIEAALREADMYLDLDDCAMSTDA